MEKRNGFHQSENQLSPSKNFSLKNWIPPDFNNGLHKQKESSRILLLARRRFVFFLISIMVSTSRNKSRKIRFCPGEIIFSSIYSIFVLVEAIIKTKCKNSSSHLSDISGCENDLSHKWKFLIPTSGNEFSVQQKQYYFTQNFVEDFKVRGSNFLRETLFLLIETFFLASGSYFPAIESYFSPSRNLFTLYNLRSISK